MPEGGVQAPPQVTAGQTQLPCPACKRPVVATSRVCPHCGQMIDAMAGIVFQSRAADVKLSGSEKAYLFVSWGRIVMGALAALIGLTLMRGELTQTYILILATASVISGVALLLEIEWMQFLIYWGSLLSIVGGLSSILMNVLGNNIIGIAINVFDICFSILTMWAIKQMADV